MKILRLSVDLSYPTDSPDPASLDHPELSDSSDLSQSSSSFADMFTNSLNSLFAQYNGAVPRTGLEMEHTRSQFHCLFTILNVICRDTTTPF